MVERRRGKIELDFGLLVTFQIIRLDKTSRRKVQTIVWFEQGFSDFRIFSENYILLCVLIFIRNAFDWKCTALDLFYCYISTLIIHIWYGIGLVFTYLHRLQIQFISFKVGSKDANGTVAVQLKFFANPQ